MARTFGGATTDVVIAPYSTHQTTSTFALWVYRTGVGGSGGGVGFGYMFCKCQTATSSQGEVLYRDFDGGVNRYKFFRERATTDGSWHMTAPALNELHHICVTYDSSDVANDPIMYLDGVSQ